MTEHEIPTAKDLLPMISRLQSRVKELEEAENDRRLRECSQILDDASPAQANTSSLLERVSCAIDRSICPDQWLHLDAARDAILEVASWLRDRGGYPHSWLAEALEKEADRPTNGCN